jgi:hypothetical protein
MPLPSPPSCRSLSCWRAGGLAGWRWHLGWLSWAAVPVGLASGTWLALGLGRRAIARLEREQVRILKVLADAAR